MPYYYPTQNNAYPTQMNVGSTQPTQIQNGGFVPVRSETEARNYPIAPGTSITFKNEIEPYVYTKTMGFSQLDRPIFDKYRLVKEDPQNPIQEVRREAFDIEAINSTIDKLKAENEAIWTEIEGLKNASVSKKTSTRRKDDSED